MYDNFLMRVVEAEKRMHDIGNACIVAKSAYMDHKNPSFFEMQQGCLNTILLVAEDAVERAQEAYERLPTVVSVQKMIDDNVQATSTCGDMEDVIAGQANIRRLESRYARINSKMALALRTAEEQRNVEKSGNIPEMTTADMVTQTLAVKNLKSANERFEEMLDYINVELRMEYDYKTATNHLAKHINKMGIQYNAASVKLKVLEFRFLHFVKIVLSIELKDVYPCKDCGKRCYLS